MARSYALPFSVTTPNSASLPVASIIGATTVRPKLYDMVLGSSSTPADNSGRLNITRCSTAGTPGSSPTPSPLDPGDPACTATAGLAIFSVGPTLGNVLLQFAMNQRATFRWVAAPAKELIVPATANNGLCLVNPVVNSTFTLDGVLEFEE